MLADDDKRHGTTAGYIAETHTNTPHCQPCRDARAYYQRHREYDNALGRPRKLPAIGARRRVRALQRLGWSLTMIANEAGWNSPEALQYVMRSASITRRSWERIDAAYERLSMQLPPYCSASVRARKHAEREGYAPPLAWNSIDDPDETPTGFTTPDGSTPSHYTGDLTRIDPVVVDRILDGEWRLPCSPAEKTAVCQRFVGQHGTTYQLAQLTGWRVSRYWRKDAA